MEGCFFMKRYVIEQKLKTAAAFLIILILLPYVVSVFVNGVDVAAEDGGGPFYVRIRISEDGEKEDVKEVNWTEYLAGILAGEMSEDSGIEALKAQAVVIRTQIYQELSDTEDKVLTEDYLTRDEMEKRWGADKFSSCYEKYIRAVEETDDTVLMYGDACAWTPFHQSSCGMTRSAAEVLGSEEYPYIAVRECALDKEAEEEIGAFHFTYREVQEMCRDFLVAEENTETASQGYSFADFEILSYDSAGYVSKLQIGNTECTGDQFRDALSLPSSCFSLSEGENELIITTTGRGHGLGMSLWTARKMAEEGKSYGEILAFFYEGTELRNDMPETELF